MNRSIGFALTALAALSLAGCGHKDKAADAAAAGTEAAQAAGDAATAAALLTTAGTWNR